MPTFTDPSSGWAAECRDCPHTIGLDYGEPIYPRSESGDRADVERWAATHVDGHPGHQPKITEFHRWTMSVIEHLDVKLLNTLFDGRLPIPRVDDDGWHYLLMFPDHTVVQCAGNWDVAHKHLRAIRADWDGDTVPTLIGAYPPNAVGGPQGRGGVFSYGYTPTLIGNIDIDPNDWTPA